MSPKHLNNGQEQVVGEKERSGIVNEPQVTEHNVHRTGDRYLDKKQAERIATDVIRAAAPDVYMRTEHNVHRIGDRYLDKKQAERIATALLAEFDGGKTEQHVFDAKPSAYKGAFGVIRVWLFEDQTLGAIVVNIFYDKERETSGVASS